MPPESQRAETRARDRGSHRRRRAGPPARARREASGGASSATFALSSDVPLRSAPPPANERRSMAAASLTWLGHASFRVDSPGGKRVYVDPWLDNPKCAANEKDPERCDVIAVTHGHSDHLGSVVAITEKLASVPIVAPAEQKVGRRGQGA